MCTCTYIRTVTRAQCTIYVYTRISVHGFINWITLTKRPPETREHPALRKETGHSKTTLLALFLLHFPSLPSPSLPPLLCILLLTRSCFFRGDRIRGLTDGNHDPLCPSRGLRHFDPAFLSRLESSGKTPRLCAGYEALSSVSLIPS